MVPLNLGSSLGVRRLILFQEPADKFRLENTHAGNQVFAHSRRTGTGA